ncbi:DNA-binding CsgD family transcriptional regulator [Tenggerimyces flavus]|nr:DNA-binding CsgD family transcriptional regulator [Tenggerimyces flavus]
MPVVDGLIQAIASLRPVVLVVDDVQWADSATRDALTYLVAGFRSQRLAILATYRDEELAPGDPLHVWLADLVRLPSVSTLRLDRMSPNETEGQVTLLLGGRSEPHLLAEVTRLADGNPYLSELLVHGLTAADEELPTDLPDELTDALLAAWHRLSVPSREVMRLLAIGGRPATADVLVEVAATRGIAFDVVTAALVESTQNGICVASDAETCWFRHPLLAEVLEASFVPGEAVPVHAAWAATLEHRMGTGVEELRRVGDLARHYEGAHDPAASLEVSLRAVDLAKGLKALSEEAVHLRRALRLWPAEETDGELDLLDRLATVNWLADDGDEALAAMTRSLELVDEHRDPLRASWILRCVAESEYTTGRRAEGEDVEAVRRALELATPYPDSPQYAQALADLSGTYFWVDEMEAARQYADEAIEAAHRAGSHRALMRGYTVAAYAYQFEDRAGHDSVEAMRHARLFGDPRGVWGAGWARKVWLNWHGRLSEAIPDDVAALSEALDAGATNVAALYFGDLARIRLVIGQHAEAEQEIRQGLALARVPYSAANVRLAAALLATRQGDLAAARLHRRRAYELIPDLETRPSQMAPPTLAEILIAEGRPADALDLLARTMEVQIVDPRIADEMLVLSARSAADLAEHARDLRDLHRVSHARQLLDSVDELRRKLLPPPFATLTAENLIQPAFKTLYVAETARCWAQPNTSELWEEATHRCASAGLRWDEAIARYRWAQALLHERAGKAAVAVPLRTAYKLTDELGAGPHRHLVEELAALARISLSEPDVAAIDLPAAFRSLTHREREVLSHLVVNRTYAEIARALFISEKTVSVHVSNLLRKTGATSSRELAAVAQRIKIPIEPA